MSRGQAGNSHDASYYAPPAEAAGAPKAPTPEPFVDIAAAAAFLGVRVSYLYDQIQRQAVPSYKVGKFRRFRLSELAAWAEAHRSPSA